MRNIKHFFFLVIIFFQLDALAKIPGFNDRNAVKEILEECSSKEVTTFGYLYIGEGLDKNCLISKYNKVFKQEPHKNRFAYTDWSTDARNKVYPEYQTEIKDYASKEDIKTVTSIWNDVCGETCEPGKDYLYEVDDKFWYLVSNWMSSIRILKIDDKNHPLLILVKDHHIIGVSPVHIIHIPKGKMFNMGNGQLSFSKISIEEIVFEYSYSKSYFLLKEIITDGKSDWVGGGAFWFNASSSFNFDSEKFTDKYINPPSDNCMKKEDFIEKTEILPTEAFDHIDGEICWWDEFD